MSASKWIVYYSWVFFVILITHIILCIYFKTYILLLSLKNECTDFLPSYPFFFRDFVEMANSLYNMVLQVDKDMTLKFFTLQSSMEKLLEKTTTNETVQAVVPSAPPLPDTDEKQKNCGYSPCVFLLNLFPGSIPTQGAIPLSTICWRMSSN